MEWNRIVFSIIITLLYVPLVFMGANVSFPDMHYPVYNECYQPKAMPVRAVDESNTIEYENCQREYQKKVENFEKEKRKYDSWKYLSIVLFSLIIMGITLFVRLNDSIMYGLFAGATIATFMATIIYFSTRSRLGFSVLVLVFIATLYFVNKIIKRK